VSLSSSLLFSSLLFSFLFSSLLFSLLFSLPKIGGEEKRLKRLRKKTGRKDKRDRKESRDRRERRTKEGEKGKSETVLERIRRVSDLSCNVKGMEDHKEFFIFHHKGQSTFHLSWSSREGRN